jgi:hypothetical protein
VSLCLSPLASFSLLSCPLGCSSTSIPHKLLVGIQHNVVIKHVAMGLVAVIRVVHCAVLGVALGYVAVIRDVHCAVLGVAIRHVVERFHPPIGKQTVQLSVVSCQLLNDLVMMSLLPTSDPFKNISSFSEKYFKSLLIQIIFLNSLF